MEGWGEIGSLAPRLEFNRGTNPNQAFNRL
jgi:hypothetical protein